VGIVQTFGDFINCETLRKRQSTPVLCFVLVGIDGN
jgi:hypothetical protein